MNEVEILTVEKRQAIKDLLHCIDVGLSNFNYATICNHKLADADKITGFQGEGDYGHDYITIRDMPESLLDKLKKLGIKKIMRL